MRYTLFLGIAGLLSVGSTATVRASRRQASKSVGRGLSSSPSAPRLHTRQTETNVTSEDDSGDDFGDDTGDDSYEDPSYVQPYIINDQYNLTVFATSSDELPDDATVLNSTYSDALKYALSRNGPTQTNTTFEDPFVWNGQRTEYERLVGFIKSKPGTANLTWSLAATTLTGLQKFFTEAQTSNSSDLYVGQTFLVVDRKSKAVVAEGSFGSTPLIDVDANATKAPGLVTFPVTEDLQIRYNTSDAVGGSFSGQFMAEQLGDCSDASDLYQGFSTVDGSNTTITTSPWTWVTHSNSNTSNSSFNLVISQLHAVDQSSVADVLDGIAENITNAGYFVGGSFVVVNTTNSTTVANQPVMYGVLSNKAITNATFAGSWAAQNVTASAPRPVAPAPAPASGGTSSSKAAPANPVKTG